MEYANAPQGAELIPVEDPVAAAAARLQAVFARDYARLCAAARGMLGDAHLAQDAVQEAWLRLNSPRVLAGLDVSDEAKLRSLVLIAVRSAARNLTRRTRREQPAPDETWAGQTDPDPLPAEQAERRDAARALRAALARLEETDRQILLLQYDNGCTSRQIAALLNMREAAVRQRARRARLKLRAMLEEGGAL